MSNLVCFGAKIPGILDILSHQVGVDVQGQVVEEEPLEHEAFRLVDPMTGRERMFFLFFIIFLFFYFLKQVLNYMDFKTVFFILFCSGGLFGMGFRVEGRGW